MASQNDDREAAHPAHAPVLTSSTTWRVHVMLAACLALCAAAFYVELHRAIGGNGLSWAYVFEWPLLGVFSVYMWWKFLHPANEEKAAAKQATIAPEFEGMRAAWEDHRRQVTQASDAPLESES